MSTIQKIIKFIFPKSIFKKIEEESKKYFFRCNECGYEKSVWNAGGVRAFAKAKKKAFGICPQCKKYKFLDIIKK